MFEYVNFKTLALWRLTFCLPATVSYVQYRSLFYIQQVILRSIIFFAKHINAHFLYVCRCCCFLGYLGSDIPDPRAEKVSLLARKSVSNRSKQNGVLFNSTDMIRIAEFIFQ